MPKTPTTSCTPTKPNPYNTASSPLEDIKPTITISLPKKCKNGSGETSNRRPWSNAELTQLFEHVIKNGASGKKVWESAVDGRTANQAYQTWLQTLAPFLRNAIEGRKGK